MNIYNNKIHLHIGAGKIGCSLVIPLLNKTFDFFFILVRPSSEKYGTIKNNYISIYENMQEIIKIKVARTIDEVCEGIKNKQNLFIISDELELLDLLAINISTISCSVGKDNLKNALKPLVNSLKKQKREKINLYTFENDTSTFFPQ